MENIESISSLINSTTLPIEFKYHISEKGVENIVKAIGYLSNGNGGYIVLGGENKTKLNGIERLESNKIIDSVQTQIKLRLTPVPTINIKEEMVNGRPDKVITLIQIIPSKSITLYVDGSNKTSILTKKNLIYYPMSKAELSMYLKQRSSKYFDNELTSIKYNDLLFTELSKKWANKEINFSKETASEMSLLGSNDELTYGLYFFSNNSSYPSLKAVGHIYSGEEIRDDELLSMAKSKGNIISLYDFCYSFIDSYVQLDSPSCPYKKDAIINAILLTLAKRNYLDEENIININIFSNHISIGSNGDIANEGEFILPYLSKVKLSSRNYLICNILFYIYPIGFANPFEKIIDNYKDENSSIYPLLKSGYQKFEFIFTSMKNENENEIKEELKGPIYKLDYKKISKGNREYDNDILSLCFDSAKSRQEIAKLTPYTSRSSFLTSVLNPLLEASLLLPTTKFKTSPNNKYFTNPAKVKRIKK